MRCASLLLASVLLLSLFGLSAAQSALHAPVLNNATLSSDGYAVYLGWAYNHNCPSTHCVFQIFVDSNTSSIGSVPLVNGVHHYTDTVQVLTSSIPAGVHFFYVNVLNLKSENTGPDSNVLMVDVLPAAPTPDGGPQGGIAGDPQFTGLRGQQYQVHGIPNEVFSIISDTDLQYNARFVFLSRGLCPVMAEGKRLRTPCFTHPGTYLGEMALQNADGDRLHLMAGPASTGFSSVTLNGEQLQRQSVQSLLTSRPHASFVVLNSSHVVTVQMGNFWLEFSNSDLFINQQVRMIDTRSQSSHGLLGQTWSAAIHDATATIPWIEGNVWDYAMADHEMFSHRFLFNRFETAAEDGEAAEAEEETEEETDDEHARLIAKLKAVQAKRSQHQHSHSHLPKADRL
jgi:hypothetical protein